MHYANCPHTTNTRLLRCRLAWLAVTAAEAAHLHKHPLLLWRSHMVHQGALCSGPSCARMSDLLPQLRFKTEGQKLTCVCADYMAARCFAPGCFPCDKSCFTAAGQPLLALEPGPFGTGLLCSVGCQPCCQKDGDPDRPANSTCRLVGDC